MLVWKLDIVDMFKYVYQYAFALLLSKPLNRVSVLIEVVQLPDSMSFHYFLVYLAPFELTTAPGYSSDGCLYF
jgi:hypothetical protein